MSFLQLPNEILLHIAESLTHSPKDFYHLLSTSHHLYHLLISRFHRLALGPIDGQPALHWAAKRGHISLVLLLLSKGVDIDLRESSTTLGKTALHCAAELGPKPVIITTLLENGASINLQDNEGGTALSNAIESRNLPVFQVLLDNGADVNVPDNKGLTALHWAVYTTRKTSNDTEELIKLLISKGAIIDHLDHNNMSPLYLAMSRQHITIVRLLLKHGADLFLQRDLGYGAIRRAIMNNNTEMVELFLEQQGVDVNHQDEDGKTVLHCAAGLTVRGGTWDLGGIIRLLIKKGGDVSIKDNYGMKPLVLAKYATEEIRKLLEPVGLVKSGKSIGSGPLGRSRNFKSIVAKSGITSN